MSNKITLMEVLDYDGNITTGIRVETSTIKEMSIYGFIPLDLEGEIMNDTSNGKFLDFEMKGTLIASDRLAVKYSIMEETHKYPSGLIPADKYDVHPILDRISLQEHDVDYKLPMFGLFIPKFRNDNRYKNFRKSVNPRPSDVDNISNLKNVIIEEHPGDNDLIIKVAYYIPEEEDFLFQSFFGDKTKAVGKSFSVVCRRINPVTGNVQLELYKPEELFVEFGISSNNDNTQSSC